MKKLIIFITFFNLSCAQNESRPSTVTGILTKQCPIQGSEFTSSNVLELMAQARPGLVNAVGHDLKPIPKETQEEKKVLLLDILTSKCVLDVSYVSAKANLCGVDYQKNNYIPLMQMLRSNIGKIDKPIAFAGLLHGVGLEVATQHLNKNNFKCSKKDKEDLEAQLAVWK